MNYSPEQGTNIGDTRSTGDSEPKGPPFERSENRVRPSSGHHAVPRVPNGAEPTMEHLPRLSAYGNKNKLIIDLNDREQAGTDICQDDF